MFRKFFKIFFLIGKWTIIPLVTMEIDSFPAVSLSNYIIFGKIREGSRVVSDPCAIHLNIRGVRPTVHNAPLASAR